MLTVGAPLVEPALLETTPVASTPVIEKVYVLFGVISLEGMVFVVVVVFPQAGVSRSEPLNTNRPSSPHIFLDRFPPVAAPSPSSASIGTGNHSALNIRPCAIAREVGRTVFGPMVLMVRVAELATPFTDKLCADP